MRKVSAENFAFHRAFSRALLDFDNKHAEFVNWMSLSDYLFQKAYSKVLSQTRMRIITYKAVSTCIGWFSLLKYASTTKRQKLKFNVYKGGVWSPQRLSETA